MLLLAVALTPVLLPGHSASAGECVASPGNSSADIVGEAGALRPFQQPFGPGLTFHLLATDFGFRIAVHDERGKDISYLTPPLRGINDRFLDGWHFRNRDNTGANEGSVNAPQKRRGFIFSPEVGRSLGVGPEGPTHADIERILETGRGDLEVLDYGLADLESGQRARMVWLSFRVCLEWDRGIETRDGLFPPAAVTDFEHCGLAKDLTLSGHMNPRFFEADFDGDGNLDLVAPVRRTEDGKRALAFCHRKSQRLSVVGLHQPLGEMAPEYVDRMDWWALYRRPMAEQGASAEAPPELQGDALTVGIEGASSVLIYWQGERYASYWQGD